MRLIVLALLHLAYQLSVLCHALSFVLGGEGRLCHRIIILSERKR